MKRSCVVLLLLPLLLGGCSTASFEPTAYRVVATPVPTAHASVSVELPKAKPKVLAGKPKVAALVVVNRSSARRIAMSVPPVPVVSLASFRSLGSWIDVFDYTDDPATVVPLVQGVAKQGTKTLYLETARYQSATDIQFPNALGAALDEAKAHGMRVVAWYPPTFDDMSRDVRRSMAAISFSSPKGNRFDAFGADIEYTQGVPDHAQRSNLAVAYSRKLRSLAGRVYPLAAIVIPPTSLEMNKTRWPDFPWKSLAVHYDVFMPMNYWTAHGADPATAADLTKRNVEMTRSLTGKPVHIIGGLGENADAKQVAAYVKAARGAGAIGGGLYDYRTTRSDVWGELRKLL